jgi:pyruvate dehydrogenase E1 component alpha subunit
LQKRVFDAYIDYIQVMDEEGNIDSSLMPKDVTDELIIKMYKNMALARAFDAKALSLQRQGRIVTYAPLLGQEATQVGSGMAMRGNDFFVPNFRQHALYIMKGLPMENMFISLRGFEEGANGPKDFKGFPVVVPVGSQVPHAVGLAYAQKYKKTGAVVVSYVGDGGTSEGDFNEGINFAGVWKAPLVMIIENNQWAISIPRKNQTAAATLAQKAFAAGLNGLQVDGNDVIAVYKVISDAINLAANGAPQVIECVTYRLGLHTTSDDPGKYRSEAETKEWERRDPIARVRKYLVKKGIWNDAMEQKMADDYRELIDSGVAKAEAFKPDPKSMFEHIYSFMPDTLKEEEDDAAAANYWQG